MKKNIIIVVLLAITVSVNSQTVLNESGAYELKVVEQFDNISLSSLYEQSLMALSDVVGAREKSKTNLDIADEEAGTIVYKGGYYLGFRKVNAMCGYNVIANFTLKVRCKDGRIQYTITVPSFTLYWSCDESDNEMIPLNEIIPEYTHKGRLYYLKKSALQFAETLDDDMKSLQQAIVSKTKAAADDDF